MNLVKPLKRGKGMVSAYGVEDGTNLMCIDCNTQCDCTTNPWWCGFLVLGILADVPEENSEC